VVSEFTIFSYCKKLAANRLLNDNYKLTAVLRPAKK
jgi:hypothetical protein